VGFGDTLGRDDGVPLGAGERLGVELGLTLGFEDMVVPVDGAKLCPGDPEGTGLGPVLGTDDKVGERLGSLDGAFE
jgi:hypothetical protein